MEIKLRIDVFHHSPSVEEKLGEALSLLRDLKSRLGAIMAVSQEIKDLTAKIDQATTDVGARIERLMQSVKNNMTDAEVAEVKAGLQAEVDRLTAMGQDPNNPVPPAPVGGTRKRV